MKENLLAFRWNPITMDRQNIKIRGIGRPRCAGLRRLQNAVYGRARTSTSRGGIQLAMKSEEGS